VRERGLSLLTHERERGLFIHTQIRTLAKRDTVGRGETANEHRSTLWSSLCAHCASLPKRRLLCEPSEEFQVQLVQCSVVCAHTGAASAVQSVHTSQECDCRGGERLLFVSLTFCVSFTLYRARSALALLSPSLALVALCTEGAHWL